MAGTKFQYDESGTTFYYFVLTFLALVVIPVTYFFWPRSVSKEKPSKKITCHCEPCLLKQANLKANEPSKHVRQCFIKIIIILSWIALCGFAYKVANIQPDYVNFDPYEILAIQPGASKSAIKKAYHELSRVYHPDKEQGDAKMFMLITKAHAALTDETARKNWEEFGNPDGPGAATFGIALPSWIVEKENSITVLMVYVLCLMIALPIGVRIWWSNSSKYGGFKVLLDTSQLYYYYIHKTPSMMLRKVLMVIGGSFEFDKAHNSDILERPSDNQELPLLIKEIPHIMPNNREAPLCFPYSIKARALLYAHLMRLPLPPQTLEQDKNYILKKCPYLIQEFVQCGAQLTVLALTRRIQRGPSLETIENAMKLNAMVVQGLWLNKNALLQVPHLDEDMLRHFINRKRNIRNMQQLAQMDETDRRQMLRCLSDVQYDDVIHFIGQLPLLDIDVRSEVLDDEDGGKITAGALVTVTVTLTRRPMSILFDKNAAPSNAANTLEEEEEAAESNLPNNANHNRIQNVSKGNKNKRKAVKGKKKPVMTRRQSQTKANSAASSLQVVEAQNKIVNTIEQQDSDNESHDDNQQVQEQQNTSDGESSMDEDQTIKQTTDKRATSPTDDDDEENDDMDYMKQDVHKKEIFPTISKISHSVHCPLFPEDKQEHWWIYISDRKKPSNLITVPYFMTNLVEQEEIELKFTAPLKPGSYPYMVNVRCDSYVDMDYFKPFKIYVNEAPKEIETHPQWEISEEEEEQNEDDDSAVSDSDLVDSDDATDGKVQHSDNQSDSE